jgi:hypothetical protein
MSKHTLLVSHISEGATVDEVRQHFQYALVVVGWYMSDDSIGLTVGKHIKTQTSLMFRWDMMLAN